MAASDLYQPQDLPTTQGGQTQLTPDLRQSYIDYVNHGLSLGPQDFHDAYHSAGHAEIPDLKDHLLDNQTLTDHSIEAVKASSLPLSPDLVAQARDNISDYWVRTGQLPNLRSGPVADAMTRRPPLPFSEEQFLDMAEKFESGGKNVVNFMFDKTHTASGNWQITNTNWKHYGPQIGVDLDKFPTALDAPRDVQKEVARAVYRDQGPGAWTRYNARLAFELNVPEELRRPARDAVYDPMGTLGSEKETPVTPGFDLGKLSEAAGIPSIEKQLADIEEHKKKMKEEGASASEIETYGNLNNPFLNAFGVGSIGDVVGNGLRSLWGLDLVKHEYNQESKEFVQSSVRAATGEARRTKNAASEALEQFRSIVNKNVPDFADWLKTNPGQSTPLWQDAPAIMHLIGHIEGQAEANLAPNSPLFPVAEALRERYAAMKAQIQEHLPDMDHWIEDYYRHLWVRPTQADLIYGAAGRQGTRMSLNRRTIPTIAEGIAQGLRPRILDPIENTLHYISGMTDYLHAQRVLKEGQAAGYVKFSKPGSHPPGWIPLNGRSTTMNMIEVPEETLKRAQSRVETAEERLEAAKARLEKAEGDEELPGARRIPVPFVPLRAYAPPGYATSYNNWVSRGIHDWWPAGGKLYDKLQRASNALTGLVLGLSGFHPWVMAHEAMASSLAKGLGEFEHGELVKAVKDFGVGATVLGPTAQKYRTGKWLQQAYLHPPEPGQLPADPVAERLASLYAKVGGRAVGRGEEYGYTQATNLWRAFRRGSLAMELKQGALRTLGDNQEAAFKRVTMFPGRMVSYFGREMERGMASISAPLFDDVIPKLKAGSWADEMQDWIRQNPNADEQAILRQGRYLADSVDDRFGELVQDNIFWNRTAKQAFNLFSVSMGWEYGNLRAAARVGKEFFNGQWRGQYLRWLPGYVVAMGVISSLYQYFKTGIAGPSVDTPGTDLIAPRTGGLTVGGQPERATLPGNQKDWEAWFHIFQSAPSPFQYLKNTADYAGQKLNPFWRLVTGPIVNRDWGGNPIFANVQHPENYGLPSHWEELEKLIMTNEPIGFQNMAQMKKGTNIGTIERFLGPRPAAEWIADPVRTENIRRYMEIQEIEKSRLRQARQKAQQAP